MDGTVGIRVEEMSAVKVRTACSSLYLPFVPPLLRRPSSRSYRPCVSFLYAAHPMPVQDAPRCRPRGDARAQVRWLQSALRVAERPAEVVCQLQDALLQPSACSYFRRTPTLIAGVYTFAGVSAGGLEEEQACVHGAEAGARVEREGLGSLPGRLAGVSPVLLFSVDNVHPGIPTAGKRAALSSKSHHVYFIQWRQVFFPGVDVSNECHSLCV
jgi:hypothetical protein